jgi:hypothetical protein
MHAFPGRLVQRWPRTGRSSDPLQMRARRLCFRPKAQIDPRELESGLQMRIRARADQLACPPELSRLPTPRPRMQGSAHLARQAGRASLRLLQDASCSGHRQTNGIIADDAIQQVCAQRCARHFCSRLERCCCAWPTHGDGSRHRASCCVSVLALPPFWHVPPARATRISTPPPPLLLPPCSARAAAARSFPPRLQLLLLRSSAPARSSSVARTLRHGFDSSIRSRRSEKTRA